MQTILPRTLTLSSTLLCLLAPIANAQRPANDFLIAAEHVGPIRAATSAADLRKQLGATQVVDKMLDGAEGEQSPGSVVFPDSPDRVEIFWTDAARTHVATVRLATRGSHWHMASGIHPGTPLTDLVKQNGGKPIHFSGFDWDYGGYVSDWGGGPLGKTLGAKSHLTIRLGYAPDHAAHLSEKVMKAVEGERKLSSSDTAVRSLQPYVDTMTVDF